MEMLRLRQELWSRHRFAGEMENKRAIAIGNACDVLKQEIEILILEDNLRNLYGQKNA